MGVIYYLREGKCLFLSVFIMLFLFRNISFILSSQVERQGGDSNQILPDPAVINFSFPNQVFIYYAP